MTLRALMELGGQLIPKRILGSLFLRLISLWFLVVGLFLLSAQAMITARCAPDSLLQVYERADRNALAWPMLAFTALLTFVIAAWAHDALAGFAHARGYTEVAHDWKFTVGIDGDTDPYLVPLKEKLTRYYPIMTACSLLPTTKIISVLFSCGKI